jgi:GT2 family glycosyltransferase
MEVSIVIPTCRRPELLGECLRRLEPQLVAHAESGTAEVWVTDDGADELATRKMLEAEFAFVRWTAGPRRGPAANRNHGARQASAEWILFLDDDCRPEPGLLLAYAQRLASAPGCEVMEGRIQPDCAKRHPFEECPINDRGGNLWSCNFAIRRELFLEMGGFDERFPNAAGEDWEFRYRLQKQGHRIDFTPEATVTHPWRKRDLRGHWQAHARLLDATLRTVELHPELREMFNPWSALKDAVRYTVRAWPKEVAQCGIWGILYLPIALAIQLRRARAYLGFRL